MQPRILTLVTLSLTLNACVDEGVIGKEASGVGGRSNITTSAGGSTSATIGGGTSTGGNNSARATNESSTPPLFAATVSSCGITTIAAPTSQTMVLPSDLTAAEPQAEWQPLSSACADGGWDLSRCAGSEVLVTSATTDLTQTIYALPVSVNVMTQGDQVCCVTRTIAAPGGPMATACGPMSLANRAMTDCAIPKVAQLSVLDLDVPAELTGPNWAIKSEACTAGGWDLSLCAGGTATFTSFDTGTNSTALNPLTAWVVTAGGTVCCIYESEANSNPGIASISCSK
jgi:hypothetical protein